MLRKILLKFIFIDLLLISSGVLGFAQSDMLTYYTNLAKGQGKIIFGAVKVDKLLKDPNTPDSLKTKLCTALHIRRFAFDYLNLTENKNYTTYYDQKGQPLLWTITASEKYSLTPKTWKFPIAGEVGYKGFFSKDDAEAEALELQNQGYETRIRAVNAWSTLGFLQDPILSSMLDESLGELANVLIHELSHGTIFIKGNTEESENLATFIGDKGAYLYLEYYYGKDSKEYLEYMHDQEDYNMLSMAMVKGAQKLDSLYASIKKLPDTEKEILKQKTIQEIVDGINKLPFHNKDAFKAFRNSSKLPNNATFVLFRQYNNKYEKYEEEFQREAQGDLVKYIEFLKRRYS